MYKLPNSYGVEPATCFYLQVYHKPIVAKNGIPFVYKKHHGNANDRLFCRAT